MDHKVIFCIVNKGFEDAVMIAARGCGARGGTIINARGTVKEDTLKAFNIVVDPEKVIVMMIVDEDIVDPILHALYKEVGFDTPGGGIAFALPISNVVGLKAPTK